MDHLSFVSLEIKENIIIPVLNAREKDPHFVLQHLIDYALSRLHFLSGFRDRYDVVDEVGGLTLVPLVVACIGIGSLGFAIWEGIKSLSIALELRDPDVNEKGRIINNNTVATSSLIIAGLALLYTFSTIMTSALSLVTRSLVTLFHDWQPQDTDRFYDSSYVQVFAFG